MNGGKGGEGVMKKNVPKLNGAVDSCTNNEEVNVNEGLYISCFISKI